MSLLGRTVVRVNLDPGNDNWERTVWGDEEDVEEGGDGLHGKEGREGEKDTKGLEYDVREDVELGEVMSAKVSRGRGEGGATRGGRMETTRRKKGHFCYGTVCVCFR